MLVGIMIPFMVAGGTVTAGVLVVAALPLVFKYSKALQSKMVFSNCINYPKNIDYDNPSCCDVIGGRNFNIEFESVVDECPIKLGVWHIVPASMFCEVFVIRDVVTIDTRLHHHLCNTTTPVVLYCHGNSNHRASSYRLQTYRVFQELDFHIIAFDYRGFGDSTHVRPTEPGVVEDGVAVYNWLMENLVGEQKPMVIIWGHSLGAAVAANLVLHLTQTPNCSEPNALIIEAGFNNLRDEVVCHPLSKLVSWLPYYNDTILKPLTESSEFCFQTDEYLTKVPRMPILMLHSMEDKIVPYTLAVKLHDKISNSRGPDDAPLVLHCFERGRDLGHNNLCEAPDLKHVVQDFIRMLQNSPPHKSKVKAQSDNIMFDR